MTATRLQRGAPWYLLALAGVVEICSAIVATTDIGRVHAGLALPAVLAYAAPAAAHLAAVLAAWQAVRATDPRRHRAARQGLLALTACLMVAGAAAMQLRLGHLDLAAMLIAGVISGGGPLTLAVVVIQPSTDPHPEADTPPGGAGH